MVRIRATSVMGWPTWVVSIGELYEGERPVMFVNKEMRGTIFTREEAEAVMPHVLKVRPDAIIVDSNEENNQ